MRIALCCGKGLNYGKDWIGFDIRRTGFAGQLVLQDVRTIDGHRLRRANFILATPPCNEFSKINDFRPGGRAKNHPEPDVSIFNACLRIREESGVPTVIENVDRAQHWVGKAVTHSGSFFLWGDVPPLPSLRFPPKIGGSFEKTRPSYRRRHWSDSGNAAGRASLPKELIDALSR